MLDWFNGCRTPLMDGGLTGAVLGADLHHGPAHLYRAPLEASAFGLRRVVETLRDGGVPIDALVATGGLPASNALFARITADVLGEPVVVSQVPTRIGHRGRCPRRARRRTVRLGHRRGGGHGRPRQRRAPPVTLAPDLSAADAYEGGYRHYRAMADVLATAPRPGHR